MQTVIKWLKCSGMLLGFGSKNICIFYRYTDKWVILKRATHLFIQFCHSLIFINPF